MGDPETEVVMPRLKSDFVQLLRAAAEGRLAGEELQTDSRTAATVMLVSGGYPGAYEKGKRLSGLDNLKDVISFHAGTKAGPDGVVTDGGRVLALTGMGDSMAEAVDKAKAAAEAVEFDQKYFRRDIGADLSVYV
jgi:phosphoribosylamine--glycine ligase